MTNPIPPSSSQPLSYQFTGGDWVKCVLIDLYKAARAKGEAFHFDEQVVNESVERIRNRTFNPFVTLSEEEELQNRVALKEMEGKEGELAECEARIRALAIHNLVQKCKGFGPTQFRKYVQLFPSQQERIELVRQRLSHAPDEVMRDLDFYGIEDRKVLTAFFVQAAERGATTHKVLARLEKFPMDDVECSLRLAITIAKQQPHLVEDAFEYLKLGPHPLVKELIVTHAPYLVMSMTGDGFEQIIQYLAPEEKLEAVKEVMLRPSAAGPRLFHMFYSSTPISDPKVSLDFANWCLDHLPWALGACMPFLTIPDEEERIRLAKGVFQAGEIPQELQNSSYGVFDTLPYCVHYFHITDPRLRAELAMKGVEVTPAGVAHQIKNYELERKDRLLVAEKLISKIPRLFLLHYFREFEIEDPEDHFRLALELTNLEIPPAGEGEGNPFDAFKVWDHPRAFELANAMLERFGDDIGAHLPQIAKGVTDKAALTSFIAKLLKRGLRRGCWGVNDWKGFGITDPAHLEQLDRALLMGALPGGYLTEHERKKVEELVQRAAPSFFDTHIQPCKGDERKEKLERLARVCFDSEGNLVTLPASTRIKETIGKLLKYKNHETALGLSDLFATQVLPYPAKVAVFERLTKKAWFSLPMIALVAFGANEREAASFKKFIGWGGTCAGVSDLETILRTLLGLAKVKDLSDAERLGIIQKFTYPASVEGEANYRNRYEACLRRFALGSLYLLVGVPIPSAGLSTEGLEEELEKRFITLLKERKVLDLEGVDRFSEKYAASFSKTRVPHAVFTYAAQLPKEEGIQRAMNRYARSAIEGQEAFKRERYRADVSSHCRYLAETFGEAWRAWQAGSKPEPVENLSSLKEETKPFNALTFFQDKIGHHSHDGGAFSALRAFLKEPSEGALEAALAQTAPLADGSDPHKAERLCLELCRAESGEDVGKLRDRLVALFPLLAGLELANDIQGELTVRKEGEGLYLVDTDDWQDLLLAGTEIARSCQRINGSSQLNKCLLAYLVDGKNRMIAIKDRSGKLVARAIFRLLLDGPERSGGKPALFLERVYSSSTAFEKAINAYAKKRAKALKLPLFKGGAPPNPQFDGNRRVVKELHSWSSSAPYEYVDSRAALIGNGVTKGGYSVLAIPVVV